MDMLVRRYLVGAELVTVALVALLLARASTVLIAGRLATSTMATAMIPTLAPPRRFADVASATGFGATKPLEGILSRNIFCSTCPAIGGRTGVVIVPASPRKSLPTALPLALIAVMYVPPPGDQRWSIAVVRDGPAGPVGPYNVGSSIHGLTVTEIRATRIYLDGAAGREYLDLLDGREGPRALPPPAEPRAAVASALDRAIIRRGENRYEIRRATVDALLGDLPLLARTVRVVPEVENGRAVGFRLAAVAADSPLGHIGLRGGDVIHAVNGLDVGTADGALLAFTRLRSAGHIALDVARGARRLTIDYEIADR